MTKSKVIAFIVLCVAVISLVLLVAYAPASAATYPVTAIFTHNFKDTATPPKDEVGPLVVKLYDNATNVVVSTITITGPVTNQAMPGFTLTVPDNAITNVQFYATATDAAGNISVKGMSNIVAVKDLDNLAPAVITVNITITQ